jgi:hypothetical protein
MSNPLPENRGETQDWTAYPPRVPVSWTSRDVRGPLDAALAASMGNVPIVFLAYTVQRPTIDGRINLTVPVGTRSEQTLRVRTKVVASGRHGDLPVPRHEPGCVTTGVSISLRRRNHGVKGGL